MLASLKRHASRVALVKKKLFFSVRITQLVISNSAYVDSGSLLTVSFQKGGKISTSNQIVFDEEQDDVNPLSARENLSYVTILTDEQVELVVSLYKDTETNMYQKRAGKLVLRQLKRNISMGMDAFKSIGVLELQLDELAQQLGEEKFLTRDCRVAFPNLPDSSMQIVVTVRPAITLSKRSSVRSSISALTSSLGRFGSKKSENDGVDETRSTGSADTDGSTFSTLGATFYYDDVDQFAGGLDGVVNTLGVVRHSIGEAGGPSSPHRTNNRQRRSLGAEGRMDGMDAVYSDEGSMRNMAGHARRRSSGGYVMEVAMHEGTNERSAAHKPLSKRPSISKPSVAAAMFTEEPVTQSGHTEDSGIGESGTECPALREEHSAGTFSTPQEEEEQPAERTPTSRVRSRAGSAYASTSAGRASAHGDWEPVLASSDRVSSSGNSLHQYSPFGSPPASAGRKSLSRLHRHSDATAPDAWDPSSEGGAGARAQAQAYRNEETFAVYERELQAKASRIEELERRIQVAECAHREEMAAAAAALCSAEAELALLRPLHIRHMAQAEVDAAGKQVQVHNQVHQGPAGPVLGENDSGDAGAVITASVKSNQDGPVVMTLPFLAEEQRQDNTSAALPSDAVQGAETETAAEVVVEEDKQRPVSEENLEPRPSMLAPPAAEGADSADRTLEVNVEVAGIRVGHEKSAVVENGNTLPVDEVSPAATQLPENAEAIAALVNEFGRTAAEVKLLAQELLYYKQLAAEAQRAKADETMAAREAATVAVQACMRRADCEQELSDARDRIQEIHRQLVSVRIDLDDEVRRNFALRSRLQLYAEKMSAMEVEYSLSMCQLEEEGLVDELATMAAPPL